LHAAQPWLFHRYLAHMPLLVLLSAGEVDLLGAMDAGFTYSDAGDHIAKSMWTGCSW